MCFTRPCVGFVKGIWKRSAPFSHFVNIYPHCCSDVFLCSERGRGREKEAWREEWASPWEDKAPSQSYHFWVTFEGHRLMLAKELWGATFAAILFMPALESIMRTNCLPKLHVTLNSIFQEDFARPCSISCLLPYQNKERTSVYLIECHLLFNSV